MRFIESFQLYPFLDSVVSLGSAFVLGTLIGIERQYRQRTAGLRTCVLVAVGAAAFVDVAARIGGGVEAVRVISYVVSGVGFLGAGVIMREGMNVRGLNTAATLWCAAAVGACTGVEMVAEAALLTFFVIAGNTLLRSLVNAINRIPFNERALEATYEVRLATDPASVPVARGLLLKQLEAASYPVGDVKVVQRGEGVAELVATLVSTAVNPRELDQVVAGLRGKPGIGHASWAASTSA